MSSQVDGGITFTEPTAIISGNVDSQQNVSVRYSSAPQQLYLRQKHILSASCNCRWLSGSMMHVSHQVRHFQVHLNLLDSAGLPRNAHNEFPTEQPA
jgi:hypothetical protein